MSNITAETLRGRHVLAGDGSDLGEVFDVYLDDETGQPKWFTVETSRLGHKSLIPLSVAAWDDGRLRVPFLKKEIKRAPRANPGVHLSPTLELQLLEHYGLAGGATLADARVRSAASPGSAVLPGGAAPSLGSGHRLEVTSPRADRPLSALA